MLRSYFHNHIVSTSSSSFLASLTFDIQYALYPKYCLCLTKILFFTISGTMKHNTFYSVLSPSQPPRAPRTRARRDSLQVGRSGPRPALHKDPHRRAGPTWQPHWGSSRQPVAVCVQNLQHQTNTSASHLRSNFSVYSYNPKCFHNKLLTKCVPIY